MAAEKSRLEHAGKIPGSTQETRREGRRESREGGRKEGETGRGGRRARGTLIRQYVPNQHRARHSSVTVQAPEYW